MAQPGVAREPSMEEILASIRRIIESNEPGGVPAAQQALPAIYDEDEVEADHDSGFRDDAPFSSAGRNPAYSRAPEPPSRIPPPANQSIEGASARPLSLADVAARVRAASARSVETLPHEEEAPVFDTGIDDSHIGQPAVAASGIYVPQEFRQAAAEQISHVAATAGAVSFADAPLRGTVPLQETPAIESMKPVDLAPAVTVSAPVADISSVPPVPVDTLNLLSSEAGRQVARSFSELAAVFDGVERRSVEEMAVELLQPMLKEWLDDNLPTLVERLVREEIERVARGPRR